MIYKWRKGSHHRAHPQDVGEEVESLTKKNGKVTPLQVVKKARNKKSAMHCEFEWDDSKAAKEHRLHQGRLLLSHLKIQVSFSKDGSKSTEARAFINLHFGDERAYVPIKIALKDEDMRSKTFEETHKKIDSVVKDLKELQELLTLMAAEVRSGKARSGSVRPVVVRHA